MVLSVVILSYNTKKILNNCLVSVFLDLKEIEGEVIVVDNASRDGSSLMVKKEFQSVKLIQNKENLGFTKGNNLGIKASQGKYVLLLNSDTLVKKSALQKMVDFMEDHPEVGVIGPKLLNLDGTPQSSAGSFPSLLVVFTMLFKEHFGGSQLVRTSYQNLEEVDWVMGAAMMVRKDILEKTDLLDEKIFMYYEEVEWCYRIKKSRYKIYFFPQAEVIHLWQKSSISGRKTPVLANYQGLIYFYQKHKGKFALFLLRILLKLKAGISYLVGFLTGNSYLKETYGEAFQLA